MNPPPTIWAQRHNLLFLTVCLENCKSPDIRIGPNHVYFKGKGGTGNKEYEVMIELWKEIDPQQSLKTVRDRVIEIILIKKVDTYGFWPQLTKEKQKFHWLKVDFNRWKEEEDEEDEEGYAGLILEWPERSDVEGPEEFQKFEDVPVLSDIPPGEFDVVILDLPELSEDVICIMKD